jgi:hypothetical protein
MFTCSVLQAMCNGELWNPTPVHYCQRVVAPFCCESDRESKVKFGTAHNNMALIAMPEVPAPSKWTKLGPAGDFFVIGFVCHSFLPASFRMAYKSLKFKPPEIDSIASDAQLSLDLSFSEVAGKRLAGTLTFLETPECKARIIILAIATEATRYLTEYFLVCARDAHDPRRSPPLLDCLHPAYSPLTTVLQYLAHLLMHQGDDGRLIFVWRQQGFASLAEWMVENPNQLRLLRRSILLCSGSVYRRHVFPLMQPPWCLCILCDIRASDELRTEVSNKWDKQNFCCVRPGMAANWKKRGITSEHLLLPRHASVEKR